MKELYSNDINVLPINISVRGEAKDPLAAPTVKIYTSATKTFPLIGTDITPTRLELDGDPLVGRYEYIVPQNILKLKRYAKVVTSYELAGYGEVKQEEILEITQRVVSYEELNYILGLDTMGDSFEITWMEYDKLETVARKVVEAYIGQPLNLWEGTREVYSGKNYIGLPQHMEYITAVDEAESIIPSLEVAGGFYLTESGLALSNERSFPVPDFLTKYPKNNVTHVITGLWGYEGLPSAITQAAIEVLLMFNTDTVNARRQFLSNLRDDRSSSSLRFNWMSYTDTTGNPIADDLLDAYRIYNAYAI